MQTLNTKALRVIDISLPIEPAVAPVGPDDIARMVVQEKLIWPIETYGSYVDDSLYQVVRFKTHLRTHIESPYHLEGKGKALSDFPPETFFGRMVLFTIDVPDGTEVTADMLAALDKDRLQGDDIAVVHTTWQGGPRETKPVLLSDGAQYFVDKGIKLFGQDESLAISKSGVPGSGHDFLLKNDIPLLEMLCNLDQLTQDVSFIIAIPGLMKIQGIDASTVQAVVLEGLEVL
jgi:kynurenine formamidase